MPAIGGLQMTEGTAIRAGHLIGYADGGHRHIEDGVVAFEGDAISWVGPAAEWKERADYRFLHLPDALVTPGLINLHAHIAGSPLDKSFIEDVGRRQFGMSGLFEMLPARGGAQDDEGTRASVDFSMLELLRSGTTTLFSMDPMPEYIVERAAAVGLRVTLGRTYRSGAWATTDGRQVTYRWDEQAGLDGLKRATQFIDQFHGAHDGLINGMLCPMQVDTCTEELLTRSVDAARDLGVAVQTHAAQSVLEYQEIMRRHGRTPIEWLADIGFLGALGPRAIVGHAIFLNSHSWIGQSGQDLQILGATNTTVAHAPWVFARRGIALESFGDYLDAGVNMAIGTDTAPQSMLEAMRWAAVLGKVTGRNAERSTAADVFNAATLGGAAALGREDLGYLAPGAKADLLVWNASSTWMSPLRDPLKNLVYSAREEDLCASIINGRWVMEDRAVPGVDAAAVADNLQRSAERLWDRIPTSDWAERSVDELSPPSIPGWAD